MDLTRSERRRTAPGGLILLAILVITAIAFDLGGHFGRRPPPFDPDETSVTFQIPPFPSTIAPAAGGADAPASAAATKERMSGEARIFDLGPPRTQVRARLEQVGLVVDGRGVAIRTGSGFMGLRLRQREFRRQAMEAFLQEPARGSGLPLERHEAGMARDGPLAVLHFDPGSARLTPGALRRASRVAAAFGATSGTQTLRIIAFADTAGPAKLNRMIATERAQRVADLLVRLGVPRDRLEQVAAGEEGPLPEATPDQTSEPLNRVAHIIAARPGHPSLARPGSSLDKP